MTTELVVRASKLTAVVDVASAYSLAYVAQLYGPLQAFALSNLDFPTSQGVAVAIVGAIFASLIVLIDPVNKIVNRILPGLLRAERSPYRVWALQNIGQIPNLFDIHPGTGYYEQRARNSYWTTYVSYWRTKMSSGVILSVFLFGLVPHVFVAAGAWAIFPFVGGGVVFYSVYRDLKGKIPRFCWIVGVYGIMVEFVHEEKDNLDRIAKHLTDADWAEASWWIERTVQPYRDPRLDARP